MSDINMLHTAQAKTSATPTPAGQGSALSKGTGLFSGAGGLGLNFFDLIFAPSVDGEAEGKIKTKGAKAEFGLGLTPVAAETAVVQTNVTPVADNAATLDPALLTVSTEQDVSTDAQVTEIVPELADSPVFEAPVLPEEAGKKLAAILENLLQGLPADQQPVVVNIKSGQLKQALKTLNIDTQDIAAESQNLIATGLSPEDLTKLQELLAGDNAAEINADIQAFVVGMVKIKPDGSKGETIFLPKSLILTKMDEAAPVAEEPTDELAAALNLLEVGGTPPAPQPLPAAVPTLTAGMTITDDGIAAELPAKGSSFDDVLKLLEQIQSKTEGRTAAGVETVVAANAGKSGPVNSTLGSSFHGMLGSMMSGTPLSDAFTEGFDWSHNHAGAIQSTQITGPSSLTNLVTQAQSATQPHPATQAVAATLTRAAQGGEDKTLKLQLDPPELGRIEVHMQFSKDKTLKAHMVIEKPETMLMMQRDSQVLERALQEAGLDMSDSGLSFELSSHDGDFGRERGSSGQSSHGGGRGGDDNAPSEIIESTMTWYVDEGTGLQRYNILA